MRPIRRRKRGRFWGRSAGSFTPPRLVGPVVIISSRAGSVSTNSRRLLARYAHVETSACREKMEFPYSAFILRPRACTQFDIGVAESAVSDISSSAVDRRILDDCRLGEASAQRPKARCDAFDSGSTDPGCIRRRPALSLASRRLPTLMAGVWRLGRGKCGVRPVSQRGYDSADSQASFHRRTTR